VITRISFKEYYDQCEKAQNKANKYHAEKCRCRHGHIHDSRKEAADCEKIHLLKSSGEITDIKRQVSFNLTVNGQKICGHKPDFLITLKDGRKQVIESKGFATDAWVIKRKLFQALYPDIEYIVWR
jgi:hypothetical protein